MSPNNIVYVVDKDGTVIGYLIDWDLCKHFNRLNKGALSDTRSVSNLSRPVGCCLTSCLLQGTWEFLSAAAARYPRKPYRPSDDLESLVLVMQKMAARFHPTTFLDPLSSLQGTFEPYTSCYLTGEFHCADDRRTIATIGGGAQFWLKKSANSPAFVSLLQDLRKLLSD